MYIYVYICIYLTCVDIQGNFLGIPYLSLYTSNLAKLKHLQDFEGLYKLPRKKWTCFLKSKYLYQLLFLLLCPTLYLCMRLWHIMRKNERSKQLWKIFLCWKCWQLYLSITISLKKWRFIVLMDIKGNV